ncbi:hypothetical protein ACFS5J_11405 [Flavobacterium chuncheonense]|uniref:Lipoprotein n=1 Tax=Flavobacterium chuncheonense TaxID=2026653 RepID=A0ABW5YNF1_9FLAO
MKDYIIKFSLFTLVLFLVGCNENKIEGHVINKSTLIEFRDNIHNEGKLELISNSSYKFDLLKKYFDNIEDFKETEKEINIYPNLILINKNFKILINYELIYIEYYNLENKNIKLFKNISLEEYKYFKFLNENNKWIDDLGNVYGLGNFKASNYSLCGLMLHNIEYKYKVGKWKFWNLKRELIAEGEFVTDSSIVRGRGGCDYYIKTSKIMNDKWNFYDSDGKLKNPHFEEIYILENATK